MRRTAMQIQSCLLVIIRPLATYGGVQRTCSCRYCGLWMYLQGQGEPEIGTDGATACALSSYAFGTSSRAYAQAYYATRPLRLSGIINNRLPYEG